MCKSKNHGTLSTRQNPDILFGDNLLLRTVNTTETKIVAVVRVNDNKDGVVYDVRLRNLSIFRMHKDGHEYVLSRGGSFDHRVVIESSDHLFVDTLRGLVEL